MRTRCWVRFLTKELDVNGIFVYSVPYGTDGRICWNSSRDQLSQRHFRRRVRVLVVSVRRPIIRPSSLSWDPSHLLIVVKDSYLVYDGRSVIRHPCELRVIE